MVSQMWNFFRYVIFVPVTYSSFPQKPYSLQILPDLNNYVPQPKVWVVQRYLEEKERKIKDSRERVKGFK